MVTQKHGKARQGVVLLIILGLMAMFGMVAIAFVLVTDQSKRAAQFREKIDQYATDPQEQLHQAAMQVFRGSANQRSVLWPHSLLEDLWGDMMLPGQTVAACPGPDPMNAQVWLNATKPTFVAGADAFEFTIAPNPLPNQFAQPHQFVGRMVLITSGPCQGAVTRIVGFRQATFSDGTELFWPPGPPAGEGPMGPPEPIWKVVAVAESVPLVGADGLPGTPGDDDGVAGANNLFELSWLVPAGNPPGFQRVSDDFGPGDEFTVYGVPFGGSGLPANGSLATIANINNQQIAAVLPNPTHPVFRSWYPPFSVLGANEDYDAPDYQNMLLAMQLSDGSVPVPSLHRPALVNYWYHQLETYLMGLGLTQQQAWLAILFPWGLDGLEQGPSGAGRPADDWPWLDPTVAASIADLKRRIILRPIHEDHPEFTGSNPAWPGLPNPLLVPVFDPDANPPVPVVDPRAGGPLMVVNNYWERNGPPDVDNDGDGRAESIWVDLGFPAQKLSDGRYVKPLFAIHCVDLDGRLNLNAHGCTAHTDNNYSEVVDLGAVNLEFAGPGNPADPNYPNRTKAGLPSGQGAGAAEVNLAPLVLDIAQRCWINPSYGNPAALRAEVAKVLYRNLLLGINLPGGALDGRYGEAGLSVHLANWMANWSVVNVNQPAPGVSLTADPLSVNKHFDYPDYRTDLFAGVLNPYRTPLDMKGTLAIGVDYRGQPYYSVVGTWTGADFDYPYETDLSWTRTRGGGTPAPVDNPFGITELERLLRPFDKDAPLLPDRLERLLRTVPSADVQIDLDAVLAQRHKVTTESWDLPCPAGGLSYLAQLLINADASITAGNVASAIRVLFPLEFLAGRRMDLNRPFGDGVDNPVDLDGDGIPDAGNGVVDEPQERILLAVLDSSVALMNRLETLTPAGAGSWVPFDHDNDGWPVDGNGDGVIDEHDPGAGATFDSYGSYRQLYARHLYVLAMLLTKSNTYPFWEDTSGTGWDQAQARARWLAQWAINVVDFRDADSIMTPFPYDSDPFDNAGDWQPDQVVWGCERPELLITETIAFHDRRTEDRADEQWVIELNQADPAYPNASIDNEITWDERVDQDGDGQPDWQPGLTTDNTPGDMPPDTRKDRDFDQRIPPQGTLIVELYNPWVNHDPAEMREPPAGEFYYDRSSGQWLGGVDLTATAPGDSPVWRMIVVTAPVDPNDLTDHRTRDPDDPDPAKQPHISREIYFTAGTFANDGDIQHFPSIDYEDAIRPIPPGGYAVVGPGPDDPNDTDNTAPRADTHIGLSTNNPGWDAANPAEGPRDRQIIFNPDATLDPADPPEDRFYVSTINNGAVGIPDDIVADRVVPVVINEPQRLSITEPIGGYPTPGGPGNTYQPILDQPLDKGAEGTPERQLWRDYLRKTDTHPNFAVVHLQRLANPLMPYNAATNPYRTIDSMPVDLTTFNGVYTPWRDEDVAGAAVNGIRFSARGRGEAARALATDPAKAGTNLRLDPINLWRHEPTRPSSPNGPWPNWPAEPLPQATPSQDPSFVFAHHLGHSFSFLNPAFGPRRPDDDGDPSTPGPLDMGFPQDVFPWMTWNNRPFVSHLELLQVPCVRSSQLLGTYDIGTARQGDASWPAIPFPRPPFDPASYTDQAAPYPHLLNFFHVPYTARGFLATVTGPSDGTVAMDELSHGIQAGQRVDVLWRGGVRNGVGVDSVNGTSVTLGGAAGGGTGSPLPAAGTLVKLRVVTTPPAACFYRLFEYVEVPSRYVGTEVQTNPAMSASGRHAYHPPFNRLSRFRDPGKINLNTIYDEDVWVGLMNGAPGFSMADWTQSPTGWALGPDARFWRLHFVRSRRGYRLVDFNIDPALATPQMLRLMEEQRAIEGDPSQPGWLLIDPHMMDPDPSVRAGPLMTRINPRQPTLFANPFRSFVNNNGNPGDEISKTLLRADANSPPLGDGAARPLFAFDFFKSFRPIRPFDGADPFAQFRPVDPTDPNDPYGPWKEYQLVPDAKITLPDGSAGVDPWAYYSGPTGFNDHDRNPFFRYQALQRLGNLVTTRSNVYAVWITVGYFEVHPRPTRYQWDAANNRWVEWTQQMYRNVYPDGYTLGAEIRDDAGELRRHRAFYVFDRSQPIVFERGMDHNVGRGVLLKRFIE